MEIFRDCPQARVQKAFGIGKIYSANDDREGQIGFCVTSNVSPNGEAQLYALRACRNLVSVPQSEAA
jgi:hypothetical protein